MKFYRARIICGSKFKKKQHEETIWVKASDEEGICKVFTVVKKKSFGKLIYATAIDQEAFIKGVSRSRA
jgi:hypothetical protein